MIKKKKVSNDNVVKFPSKLADIEKEKFIAWLADLI